MLFWSLWLGEVGASDQGQAKRQRWRNVMGLWSTDGAQSSELCDGGFCWPFGGHWGRAGVLRFMKAAIHVILGSL